MSSWQASGGTVAAMLALARIAAVFSNHTGFEGAAIVLFECERAILAVARAARFCGGKVCRRTGQVRESEWAWFFTRQRI